MSELLVNGVVIGIVAAFFITLAKKWGIVEQMQMRGSELVSEMAHCDFCLSWWMSCVLTLLYVLATGEVDMVYMPFVGTMVSRFLL